MKRIVYLKHHNNSFQKNIVEDSGYSFEEHYVATDDGYIITLHRVFNSSSESQEQKPVALCVHGLVGSSADWLITGQNVSMGKGIKIYNIYLVISNVNRYFIKVHKLEEYGFHSVVHFSTKVLKNVGCRKDKFLNPVMI